MLENFITNCDNFVSTQVDHDIILDSKSYFSIYNNKISQPLHKFWFNLSNTKYFNAYNENKVLRFVLNNKSPNITKFINFFNGLSTHLESVFSKTFPGIKVEPPWKSFDSFPLILTLYIGDSILITDSDKNELGIDSLSSSASYSLLFEIKNLRVMKIDLGNEISYSIKYNLSAIMIQQEAQLNFKSYLLNQLVQTNTQVQTNTNVNSRNKFGIKTDSDDEFVNKTNFNPNNNTKPLPFLSELSNFNSESKLKSDGETGNNIPRPNVTGLINLDMLLEAKSKLKKTKESNPPINTVLDDNNSRLGEKFLEQKNQLKKVKTKEKSLLKHLRKKSKKSKKINIETSTDLTEITENDQTDQTDQTDQVVKQDQTDISDLEKELLELDIESGLIPDSTVIKKKKKSDKKNKKGKTDDNNDNDLDLEKELELLK